MLASLIKQGFTPSSRIISSSSLIVSSSTMFIKAILNRFKQLIDLLQCPLPHKIKWSKGCLSGSISKLITSLEEQLLTIRLQRVTPKILMLRQWWPRGMNSLIKSSFRVTFNNSPQKTLKCALHWWMMKHINSQLLQPKIWPYNME